MTVFPVRIHRTDGVLPADYEFTVEVATVEDVPAAVAAFMTANFPEIEYEIVPA